MSIRHSAVEVLEARRLLSFPLGIGGTGTDVGVSIDSDPTGNVAVGGSYQGPVDFDPGAGTASLDGSGGFVARYAIDGTFLWARGFNGATVNKVAVDRSGNVYAAGTFSGVVDFDPRRTVLNISSSGAHDAFVVKLTPGGNLVFARTFGGAGEEVGTGLAVDTTGDIVVGGTFDTRADFNPGRGVFSIGNSGGADGYLVELDNTGAFKWAGSFAGNNDETLTDVAIDLSGNVLATGRYDGTVDFDPSKSGVDNAVAATTQAYTVKWDTTGALVWFAGFGGTGTTFGSAVAADRAGNVYTTGGFSDTADFDPRAGTVNVIAPATGAVFVSKLDPAGTFVFADSIGGSTDVEVGPGEIGVDKSQNIYTTGQYSGTQDFDPGAGTSNLTSAGLNDVFVSKIDSNGAFVFAKSMGGTTEDRGIGEALGYGNSILTTGSFTGTANFATSGGPLNLTSNGDSDIFVSRLDANGAPL